MSSGKTLKMTGVSEADYLAATALHTRRLSFPDGIDRVFTQKSCYWKAFDRILDLNQVSEKVILSLVLKHADLYHPQEPDVPYEDQLRNSFRICMEEFSYMGASYHRADIANELHIAKPAT